MNGRCMFYQLDHPDYPTDIDQNKQNPIEYMGNDYAIPGIDCPKCDTWALGPTERIRVRITEDPKVAAMLRKPPRLFRWVPPVVWKQEAVEIALLLGIDRSLVVPGAEVGPLQIVLMAYPENDILFSWYGGMILVNDRIREMLTEINATGVAFNKVDLRWAKKKNIDQSVPLPLLWELEITGRASLRPEWHELASFCDICGRLEQVKDSDHLSTEKLRWDGSDFFTLDLNQKIVFVTERICRTFKELGATNYSCKPFTM